LRVTDWDTREAFWGPSEENRMHPSSQSHWTWLLPFASKLKEFDTSGQFSFYSYSFCIFSDRDH